MEKNSGLGSTRKEAPFLEVHNIKKNFGPIKALRGIDLSFYLGETLAIVGDNGAGKSTLIKILSGALEPTSGEIIIDKQKYYKLTPAQSIKLGISTVYQDLSLVDCRDIATNIFLGYEPTIAKFFIDKKRMVREAGALFQRLNIKNIPDMNVPVSQLSGGQRQAVAVARSIHFGGKMLIFDEPTAAMGVSETAATLELIKGLSKQGYALIIISHNLHQVFSLAQRICVIRQGLVVDVVNTCDVQPNDVVALITGAKK